MENFFFLPLFLIFYPLLLFFPLYVLSFISTSSIQPFKSTQSKFSLTLCSKWLYWKGRLALMCVALAETSTRNVLLKKVFLKISQNSQENPCSRVSFLIKLQAICKCWHIFKKLNSAFRNKFQGWRLLNLFSANPTIWLHKMVKHT